MLPKEEYVEQAYFFKTLLERIRQAMPIQEVLSSIEEEILATTNLPKAIAFLRSELQSQGGFARAMERLDHYFTPFQTFVVKEAEDERGKFDLRTGLEILRRDAEYRARRAFRRSPGFLCCGICKRQCYPLHSMVAHFSKGSHQG